MGILTGLVPQTEHVKVKERIPEMEPPRLGLELQWFDDFPGPLFLGGPMASYFFGTFFAAHWLSRERWELRRFAVW